MKYTVSKKKFFNDFSNQEVIILSVSDEENNTVLLDPMVFSKLFRQAIKVSDNVFEVNQCQESFLKKVFLYDPIMLINGEPYHLYGKTTKTYPNCTQEDDVFYVFPSDDWRDKGQADAEVVKQKRRNTV